MPKSSSHTVIFTTASTSPDSTAATLSAAVDDPASGLSSPYPPKSRVIIRLYGRRDAVITTAALGCSVSLVAAEQTATMTEIKTVIKSSRISLDYPASGIPTVKWLALKGTSPTASVDPADSTGLDLSALVELGIAEITYTTSYDKYAADNLAGQRALVLFTADDGRECSQELEIEQSTPINDAVTLTFIDYSTDAVIAGANVTVTGPGFSWSGTSNAQGVVSLTGLSTGDYTVVATASGYQATNNDILANDRFTL